ncbi:hypothetical protein AB0O20_27590 [Streptomyces kronopolitis]|uniref:hypothetical protein n=1 Tax=Streptomyces kronopolitis TaxID=1612435 RepID=UPI0034379FA0
MPELTEQQREKRREQALAAIEQGLRENHHLWSQTPPRLDWAAAYALDALGDLAAEILTDGTMMKGLSFENGTATLELEPARELLLALVASMRGMLDGHNAENYLETEITAAPSVALDVADGQRPGDSYTVTIQRRTRPTPHEFRQQAEQDRDNWKRRAVQAEAVAGFALWLHPLKDETAAELVGRLHEFAERHHPDVVVRYEHTRIEVYQLAQGCGCDENADDYDETHAESDENGEPLCSRKLLGHVCDNCRDAEEAGPEWAPDRYAWPCPPIAALSA